MPTLTLATVQENLAKWIEADAALASGQMFQLNGRMLTRSDAASVRAQINYWSRLEASLERKAASTKDQSRAGHSLAKF